MEEEESEEEIEDEFYRKEMRILEEFLNEEKNILPKQYWRDYNATLFANEKDVTASVPSTEDAEP